MIRLVRAEVLKLRTTQVWFWLLLAALGLTALLAVGQLASDGAFSQGDDIAGVFASGSAANIVVFVLGILGVTTEFRYQTITPTLLTTPSRWLVIWAKLISYALVGAVYALICLVLEVSIALPWLAAKGLSVSLTSQHVPHTLLAVFVVVTLYGVIGLGVGALLRNQIVAVSVGVVFLLVINSLLANIPGVRIVYPYTPQGAAQAVLHTGGSRTLDDLTLLPGYAGVIVLLLWALVPALTGAALTMNRDIT